jgi:hypothetical protein
MSNEKFLYQKKYTMIFIKLNNYTYQKKDLI